MSTIRLLDKINHSLARDRRRQVLAQVMTASPHSRLGATAPTLHAIHHSPAMTGEQKTQRFMNVLQWANSWRNENKTLRTRVQSKRG
jgi:hypothetical protein